MAPVLPFPIGRAIFEGRQELRWTADYARFFLSLNQTVNSSAGSVTTTSVKGTAGQINVAAIVGGVQLSLDTNVPLKNTANIFALNQTIQGNLQMPAAFYPPSIGAVGNINVLTTSSTTITGGASGLRKSTWAFFDTNTSDVDNALIDIEIRQTSNPLAATIKKSGINISHFIQPDNGGDTSGIVMQLTGGGNGLTAYKDTTARPIGLTDYSTVGPNPGYAIECGTNNGNSAIVIVAGKVGSPNTSAGLWVSMANAQSRGINVFPGTGGFDSRIAYTIASPTFNGVDTAVQYSVTLSGVVTCTELISLGAGQAVVNPVVPGGSNGAAVFCIDTGSSTNSGGVVYWGAASGSGFAGIKGLLTDGSNNTTGHLSFSTRNVRTDGFLTERMRLTSAGVLSLVTGQLQFPAVQNPSSDPNTLDDYVKGTWTPVLTFATPGDLSVSYANQVGLYTKIGRVVHLSFYINTSAFTYTTASGLLKVTGLPVTSGNTGDYATGALQYANINLAGNTIVSRVDPNTSAVLVIGSSQTGGANTAITTTQVVSGTQVVLIGSLTYHA